MRASVIDKKKCLENLKCLTLLWYHGINSTPGLFDRLNIPNFEIISFHLDLYIFAGSCQLFLFIQS